MKKLMYNIFILVPAGILIIILWAVCKTIATIFQSYFYKRDRRKSYKELQKDRWLFNPRIDSLIYPPIYGTFGGFSPWGYDDFSSVDDDNEIL